METVLSSLYQYALFPVVRCWLFRLRSLSQNSSFECFDGVQVAPTLIGRVCWSISS